MSYPHVVLMLSQHYDLLNLTGCQNLALVTLSLAHTDYEVFKEKMDFAIPNGYGFGKI